MRTTAWLLTAAMLVAACSDDGDNKTTPDGSVTWQDGASPTSDAAGADGAGSSSCKGDVCTLTGTLTESLTLTADKKWLLRGGVFIGDDVNQTVLTIEAGTTVYGETSTNGMLVIRRGSKIVAEGTKDKPIVFTSSKSPGSRARGDWGGIIINGRATVNSCADTTKTCEAYGEGGTGYYGGDKDDDDSGSLRYVRIEFAGRLISPDNELNGLALQGVGSKTRLEYIQVHMGKDDGIEFFGGAANFKYVMITGSADDNLDWTDGWRGKGQFLVAVQYEDAGDNGIEADNNAENNSAQPRSKPTLSNLTLVGQAQSSFSDLGMLLREGTAANISNVIVTNWNESCLDIDHDETFTNAYAGGSLTGELTLASSIFNCATPFTEESGDAFTVESFFKTLNTGNQIADPKLTSATDVTKLDLRPASGSPALQGASVPSDSFFDKVSFIGGVDPNNDWTKGWTTSAPN